ncbi:uncharacterized protein B0T15DRAFT_511793 [Chaetomium strumarium]|uniref:Uncharacterized protein n=1 Tax=Chaetomium strumarium TaxID=1170767 RepID=A0AAJ0GTK1_9PEZI|nr:hypothetical protein B0T15DRAFT_511793 [Chaetomium strumarium]
MEHQPSLPPSTAEQMPDEMNNRLPALQHRPILHHLPMRYLESRLVPVTDQNFAELAKECADMYDNFVASGTPNPSPPANNTPFVEPESDSILHISQRELTSFLALFHRLTVSPFPHANVVQREANLAHEKELISQQAEALAKREEDVARREAALAMMRDDEAAFNQQLTDVWKQGNDAGYKTGFEFGRREAVPLTYQLHISALEEIHRRVRELKARCDRLGARGMGGRGGMVAELDRLCIAVEFQVRKTRAGSAQKGLDLEDLMRISGVEVDGEEGGEAVNYTKFLRMAERRKKRITDGEERKAMEKERQKRMRQKARVAGGEDDGDDGDDVEMGNSNASKGKGIDRTGTTTTVNQNPLYPAAFWTREWQARPKNDGPQFDNLPSSDWEFENSD